MSDLFLSPPPPPSSPAGLFRYANPYNERNLNKIDLTIAQHQIKWDEGIWSFSEKLVLKKRTTQCYIRKEAHWDMARNCAKKAKLITLPKLLLSTILASFLTMTTQEETIFLRYLNAGMSIILALITTVSAFFDYDVKKAKHRTSSLGYNKLAVHIDRLLRLPPDERNSFGKTLAKINEQYGDLRKEAPFIQIKLMKEYTRKFNKYNHETHEFHIGLDNRNENTEVENENNTPNYLSHQNSFIIPSEMYKEFQKAEQDRIKNFRMLNQILNHVNNCYYKQDNSTQTDFNTENELENNRNFK